MSSPRPNASGKSDPLIHVTDLEFTYEGTNRPAIKEIQLRIQPNDYIIIAGPSGSGKSTLARCLAGFIPHEYPGNFQGTVTVEGQDSRTQPIPEIAKMVSLVQQDPDSQLVTLQVINEVAFGPENFQMPPEQIPTKIEWALNAIGATALQTRNTHSLSGGEKQKVVIASFLPIQAPLIIFDEPTARLDQPTTQDILKTLQSLHKGGATILVIEHRIQPFLPFATRILLMDAGRIVFDGVPSQLEKISDTQIRLGVIAHPTSDIDYSFFQKTDDYNQSILDIRNLTFSYPRIEEISSRPPALQNVTFSLRRGEIVALMGANGSGKSTLLLHLIGLLTANSGTIYFRGKEIHEMAVSSLARDIGFIFQNPLHQIFSRTVLDEVLLASQQFKYPEPGEANKRARDLLNVFDLLRYQNQSPYTLSLGEQRRLTLASVMLHNPSLLLLDEPFIGQDYQNVHKLMEILQRAALTGTAILLATQDPNIAEAYCHRLLFLRSGQILIDASVKKGLNYLNALGRSAYYPESILLGGSQPG